MIERILIVLKISAVARKLITILNAILRDRPLMAANLRLTGKTVVPSFNPPNLSHRR